MEVKDISETDKDKFNSHATHPLQSFEWGEFRKKLGINVIRRGFFHGNSLVETLQMTVHKVPYTSWTIGYVPKSIIPTRDSIAYTKEIGRKENMIFIQYEPNVLADEKSLDAITQLPLRSSAHPLFTKYSFILDLTHSEEELLEQMHPKTRYNIKVAQKHGVTVKEDNSDASFSAYLGLTEETTKRQAFYAHSLSYHKIQWKILSHASKDKKINELSSHLLVATFQNEIVVAWILFVFHDTLYYPYGASTMKYKETMASNLIMWEAIRFGKQLGLKKFDMWGAANSENPSQDDPYYGFHKFKQGYGPSYVTYVGSYDYILHDWQYALYAAADKVRWKLLKFLK